MNEKCETKAKDLANMLSDKLTRALAISLQDHLKFMLYNAYTEGWNDAMKHKGDESKIVIPS